MADPNVKMKFFGDEKDAERAIVNLEKKYEKLRAEITRTRNESKKGSIDFVADVGKQAAGLASLVSRMVAIPALISQIIDANRQWQQTAESAAISQDELFRKFRVQGGLTAVAGKEAQARIGDIAIKAGVPLGSAGQAATALVSSGFSPEESSGAALEKFLGVLAASNLAGANADPEGLGRAIGQYLEAQGLQKNAANLEMVGVSMQRLFKSTDVQLSDLAAFAPRTPGMRGKLQIDEQLAAFDLVRGITGQPETAATGLKIFTQRLSGAAEDKGRLDVLKGLKLQPDQVDFVGENLQQVLDTLGKAFEAVPEQLRASKMQKLFGTEGADTAAALIADRGKIGNLIELQRDRAGFDTDLAAATSGLAVGAQRQKTLDEIVAGSHGAELKTILDQAASYRRSQGGDEFSIMVDNWLAERLHAMKVPAEASARIAYGDIPGTSFGVSNTIDESMKRIAELQAPLGEQTEILKDIRDSLQRNGPKPARNANGE